MPVLYSPVIRSTPRAPMASWAMKVAVVGNLAPRDSTRAAACHWTAFLQPFPRARRPHQGGPVWGALFFLPGWLSKR